MINFKVILVSFLSLLIMACSTPAYMNDPGLVKYVNRQGFYVEKWFKKPDTNFKVPKGTAFYGASANRMKYQFIIKYYTANKDYRARIHIPNKNMWKINDENQNDSTYFYVKVADGVFKKHQFTTKGREMIPIKECDKNDWCKLYDTYDSYTLYIKRTIIYR